MRCKIILIPCTAKSAVPAITLRTVVESWQKHIRPRIKQSSFSIYNGILHTHLLPAFGDMPLDDLTASVIEAFLDDKSRTLSPPTVSNISTVLHSLLEHAQRSDLLTKMPLWTSPPGKSSKPIEVLKTHEKKRLVEHLVQNLQTGTRVDESFGLLLCLYTGMRLGEICALQWGDISPQGAIHIHRTVQRISDPNHPGKTLIIFDTPKSQSSARLIPMPIFLRKMLRDFRKPDTCFILTGTERYIDPRTMQNRFKSVLQHCGVRPINFHAIRHTFATDCVSAGFDAKTLSTILGHADVSITLNTYVHPSFDVKRRFMDKLRLDI